MHGYLRAIGFKGITSKKALNELLYDVIECPDEQTLVSLGSAGENEAELKKEYADGMGIIVHGYYEDNGDFQLEYYIPYLEGRAEPLEEEVNVTRHISRESYAGACEDMRMGVTLIYYLENGITYLEKAVNDHKSSCRGMVYLSGLSTQGTVLLPVSKDERQKEKFKTANMNRRKLISEAKQGDESAIESLTIEDLDTYTKISKRIRSEDVFSIVDSSFMPYGVECDQYAIIGEILSVKSHINHYSGEKVYNMVVDCNDFKMNVGINQTDLVGEPMTGMRFKGAIWLMGKVDFIGEDES